MTALTKAELAEHLSDKTNLNRRQSKEIVALFFDEVSENLVAGRAVKLSGFGNFELKDKNERPGRNPKTGKEVAISARRVVTFKAGQRFRKHIESKIL